MDKIEFDKFLEHYSNERKKGIGFSAVRKELTEKGIQDEKIGEIIRLLGQREVSEEIRKTENSKNLNFAIMGLFVFFIGLSITIYSYVNGNGQYVLWYGAILVGIGMFASGLIKYRKK